MRYRIKSYRKTTTEGKYIFTFIPEKKYTFWPFWLTFSEVISSMGDLGTVQFDSYKKAVDFIGRHTLSTKWIPNGTTELKQQIKP